MLVAALLAAACGPAAAGGAPKPGLPRETLQLSMEPVHQRLVDAALRGGGKVAEAYRKSPVLVVGIALAGVVPLLAGVFAFGRAMRRRRAQAPDRTPAPEMARVRAADKAWIEVAPGDGRRAVAFSGELLRIGRHSDNDIALDHDYIHRHHALIQRTPDHDFLLIDLTAGTGNSLLLNGAPADRAMLRDGDRIMLGESTLTFRLGAAAPVHAQGLRAHAKRPSYRVPREIQNDQRDAADEPTARAADGIATRRIGPADRLAARGADRRRP